MLISTCCVDSALGPKTQCSAILQPILLVSTNVSQSLQDSAVKFLKFCGKFYLILRQYLSNSVAIFLNPNIQNLQRFLHDQEFCKIE